MRKSDKTRKVHHNWPQIMINLIQTEIMICLWGRGTGKTEGPLADYFYECVRLMPRSLGALISVTYEKMLRFIIPKLVKSWERYGYIENVHYWIRKYAPEGKRIPKPYLPVGDPKTLIHHWNGSGQTMISMDRKGIGNASDLDYIGGDECRLFKKENLDESLNANRGNIEYFGNCHLHHTVLLTSDMPQDMKGRWLLDFYDLVDKDVINMILMLQQKIYELKEELESKRSEASKAKIQRIINKYMKELKGLRRGEVFVSEASTFDNVHALGIDFIRNLKRTLSDHIWQLSVLNEKVARAEHGFYPMFDEDQHGYTATNTGKLDAMDLDFQKEIEKDHTWDTDCKNALPLHIGMDYNKAISWVVVGQKKPKKHGRTRELIELQNSMYVKFPKKIKNLIQEKFIPYYKSRPNKTIYYYYDHTATGEDASRDISYADEVMSLLRKAGFTVVGRYIGRAPSHHTKYDIINELFEGKNPEYPEFGFNKNNNEALSNAIKQTDSKHGKNGFEKNKDPEKDTSFPQEEAPHGTDAMDNLLIGLLQNKITYDEPSGGAIYS